ncbi:hypothetical protein D3C73_1408640 [compost metagenome]
MDEVSHSQAMRTAPAPSKEGKKTVADQGRRTVSICKGSIPASPAAAALAFGVLLQGGDTLFAILQELTHLVFEGRFVVAGLPAVSRLVERTSAAITVKATAALSSLAKAAARSRTHGPFGYRFINRLLNG